MVNFETQNVDRNSTNTSTVAISRTENLEVPKRKGSMIQGYVWGDILPKYWSVPPPVWVPEMAIETGGTIPIIPINGSCRCPRVRPLLLLHSDVAWFSD